MKYVLVKIPILIYEVRILRCTYVCSHEFEYRQRHGKFIENSEIFAVNNEILVTDTACGLDECIDSFFRRR